MRERCKRPLASVIFFFSIFPLPSAINETIHRREKTRIRRVSTGGDSRESPRKSAFSTRCRLSSGDESVPSSSTISTPSTLPDWKGTLGVSLRAPPKVLLVDHEMQHRRCTRGVEKEKEKKKERRKKTREGLEEGKETPVEPLEMSTGRCLRQAGSFRVRRQSCPLTSSPVTRGLVF